MSTMLPSLFWYDRDFQFLILPWVFSWQLQLQNRKDIEEDDTTHKHTQKWPRIQSQQNQGLGMAWRLGGTADTDNAHQYRSWLSAFRVHCRVGCAVHLCSNAQTDSTNAITTVLFTIYQNFIKSHSFNWFFTTKWIETVHFLHRHSWYTPYCWSRCTPRWQCLHVGYPILWLWL